MSEQPKDTTTRRSFLGKAAGAALAAALPAKPPVRRLPLPTPSPACRA